MWPHRPADDPYAAVINARRKHVASRTLREPLDWNATLLDGDVAAAVAALRERTDLAILGSGELIQSLMPHGLIDEYLLLVHPLVFGTGRRMFPDGGAAGGAAPRRHGHDGHRRDHRDLPPGISGTARRARPAPAR